MLLRFMCLPVRKQYLGEDQVGLRVDVYGTVCRHDHRAGLPKQQPASRRGKPVSPEAIDGTVQLVGLGQLLPRKPRIGARDESGGTPIRQGPGAVWVQLCLLESRH